MTQTPPPWRRPHIRCHWTPQIDGIPVPVPPPGTIVPGIGDDTIVYVGDDTWNATTEEIHSLAAALRHTRTVTLVGDIWQAGKPAKRALHDAWTATRKSEREAARPPQPAASAARGLCGRPRHDGQPCTQRTGWGADDPAGPCRYHGGSTVQREQQRELLVDQATRWVELSDKAKGGPLTPAEHLELLVAEKAVRTASREGRLR